ncbi:MAG: PAS domain-containing sensor histidine kinase [Proteobacteria bacterium]|nr:MAG: PAS domain-containing sensor histidine kinase [Pseudomonadota bacterium]
MDPSSTRPPLDTTQERIRQKKRLIRWTILFCLPLIPLFLWLQSTLYSGESGLPFSSNILIFGLININALLVLFVTFLILRSLAELIFERKENKSKASLKTKLISSFLSLTLVPTILLFFIALQFVSTSIEYWFNSNIEDSLQESLKLAQSIIHNAKDQTNQMNRAVASNLDEIELESYTIDTINKALHSLLIFNGYSRPDSITLITEDSTLEIEVRAPSTQQLLLPRLPAEILIKAHQTHPRSSTIIQETNQGDLIRSVAAINLGKATNKNAILIVSRLVKNEQLSQLTSISKGIEGYRQLKHFKDPFKFWLIILLLLVTLLIIFAAIWFGVYISKGITNPLEKLVLATRRIAEGDLEFEMTSAANDEIGLLVNSFNSMTTNLNNSNKALEESNRALQRSSQELEQRQRYTEIILQNVSTGVISIDENDRITTFNRFAEQLLDTDKHLFMGKVFHKALPENQVRLINAFVTELALTGKKSLERHLRTTIRDEDFSLLIHFNRLEGDDGKMLGHVVVFDNLTKIEKMQRMAAWREVARRVAHEIKNPLTPIQLSAQRLRRRYPDILNEQDSVFDKCTNTIINQVDALKLLVNEFNQFARMPKINKAPANLGLLTQDTLVLYRESHKEITFHCRGAEDIPVFNFDAEQIKRCLINLLDNAVAVLSDGGEIEITLSVDPDEAKVSITVADNGPGTSKEHKEKLFEPYFSTKKTGTGLGLAIVSTIVSDHDGSIRVLDNKPSGLIFVIELPLFDE